MSTMEYHCHTHTSKLCAHIVAGSDGVCNGVAVGLYVYSIGLLSMRGREHVDVQCGRQ